MGLVEDPPKTHEFNPHVCDFIDNFLALENLSTQYAKNNWTTIR